VLTSDEHVTPVSQGYQDKEFNIVRNQ